MRSKKAILNISYHGGHSLNGLTFLVRIELSQTVGHGAFILMLRAQSCTPKALIPLPCIWTPKRHPLVAHHRHLERHIGKHYSRGR